MLKLYILEIDSKQNETRKFLSFESAEKKKLLISNLDEFIQSMASSKCFSS
jgi:hypothetical protein